MALACPHAAGAPFCHGERVGLAAVEVRAQREPPPEVVSYQGTRPGSSRCSIALIRPYCRARARQHPEDAGASALGEPWPAAGRRPVAARCYWPPFCTYERTNSSAFSSSTSSISSRMASTSSESFSCRSLTSSVVPVSACSVSSVRRVVCRWPPVSLLVAISYLRLSQRYRHPWQSRAIAPEVNRYELAMPPGGRRLVLAGQRGDQLGRIAAAIQQVADVGLGAAQWLESGHTLQRLTAGDVEDHRVPGGGGYRLWVLAQAAAAEIGPGVLRRVVDGPLHGGVVGQPDHPAPGSQPIVQAALQPDVGVLQVDELQPRVIPGQRVP